MSKLSKQAWKSNSIFLHKKKRNKKKIFYLTQIH